MQTRTKDLCKYKVPLHTEREVPLKQRLSSSYIQVVPQFLSPRIEMRVIGLSAKVISSSFTDIEDVKDIISDFRLKNSKEKMKAIESVPHISFFLWENSLIHIFFALYLSLLYKYVHTSRTKQNQ